MFQVLARKWRPINFAQIVGQEHVVRALTNALTKQRLHHAYLFTGTRGVGKTTIARILAKCFNCRTGITATPCEVCDVCQAVNSGTFVDLIEVDAASRTRIEDTKDLLGNASYLPALGKYKVYLIDEVHMLSGHSFNALLKTLEEPPAHVKFLLATTDYKKLPITVLSRCLQFNLRKLPPAQISAHLKHVLTKEEIAYEDAALFKLATAADGSLRDALTLLDQAIAFSNAKVTAADVDSMMGTVDSSYIVRLLEAVVAGDTIAALNIIDEMAILAQDFYGALEEFIGILHKIALTQAVAKQNSAALSAHANSNEVDAASIAIYSFAKTMSPEDVQLYYQIALLGKRDLLLAPVLQDGFTMIILRMLTFCPLRGQNMNTGALIPAARCRELQCSTNNSAVADVSQKIVNNSASGSELSNPSTIIKHSANVSEPSEPLLSRLRVTGLTAELLRHCVLEKQDASEVVLLLDANKAMLLDQTQRDRIIAAVREVVGSNMAVAIKVANGIANKTPATLAEEKQKQKQTAAFNALVQNQKLQSILATFDGEILADTVRATGAED